MAGTELEKLIHVEIPQGGLACYVVLDGELDRALLDETLLLAKLAEAGVEMSRPVQDAVAGLRERALREAPGPLRLQVATGTPPVHGQPGRLVMAEGLDPNAEGVQRTPVAEGDAKKTAQGKDHYSRSSFCLVKRGQTVAKLIPEEPGTDGRDVLGRTLACRAAVPFDLKIDDSLLLGHDGSIISHADGVLCVDGGSMRVTRDLDIFGSVDFSTGNVQMPGSIRVRKGVCDRFAVAAGIDLRVDGLVEAARLSADRDMSLLGGMAAKEEGEANVARDLTARYLNNVRAAVGRDLTLEAEAINCELTVGRNICGPSATLAGGLTTVGGRVELSTLGAESAKTRLHLGTLRELAMLLMSAKRLVPQVEERSAKANARLAQLRSVNGKLTHSQAEELTELEFAAAEAAGRLSPLVQRIAQLETTLGRMTTVSLVVRDRIYANTVILVDQWVIDFRSELRGPVRISLGPERQLVAINELSGNPVELMGYAKVTKDLEALSVSRSAA